MTPNELPDIELTAQLPWSTDAKGQVRRDLTIWRNYTGQSYEEIQGSGWAEALHPDDREHVLYVWERATEEKRRYEVEYRIRRHDGVYRYFLVRGVPLFTRGKVREWIGTAIDITEHREIEEREKELLHAAAAQTKDLEQVMTRLEKINGAIENASDLIFITDAQGTIIFSNKALENILGYTQEEIIGKDPFFFSIESGNPSYKKILQTIKRSRNEFKGEIVNKRKNGEEFTADTHLSPVFTERGALSYLVCIERDITEQKKLDRIKTEFISLATHQLRTPLTTIYLTAEMLLNEIAIATNKENKKYLQNILHDVKNMTSMIETLLNVSRIELDAIEIEPRLFDPPFLLRQVLEDVTPLIKEKRITLKESYATNIPNIPIDPKVMHIILENIASNAIKYTPRNGLITAKILKTNKDIIFEISNTGKGIPTGDQPHIFTKLFRAHNIKNTVDGVGLGLYMTKSLVEKSGGDIWFRSQENKETTFSISIPIKGMRRKVIKMSDI